MTACDSSTPHDVSNSARLTDNIASAPQVFELGGDAVPPAMAAGLTRLIAEGGGADGGGGEGEGDTHMRSQVVASYMDLLARPKLSDVLLTVGVFASTTHQNMFT